MLAFGAAGAGGGVFFAVVLLATHAAPASLWVWPAIAVALLIPCAAGGAALARAINARRTEP